MSLVANVIQGRTTEGSATIVLARLRNPITGALVTPASISTITYTLRDLAAGAVAGTGSLVPANVLFATLQQGGPWYTDSSASPGDDGLSGYNFSWTAPATLFAYTPNYDAQGEPIFHEFRLTLTFVDTNGNQFKQVFSIPAIPGD